MGEMLRKLRYKEGLESVVLNAPEVIEKELKRAGFSTEIRPRKPQFTLLFVKNRAEVEELFKPTLRPSSTTASSGSPTRRGDRQ